MWARLFSEKDKSKKADERAKIDEVQEISHMHVSINVYIFIWV